MDEPDTAKAGEGEARPPLAKWIGIGIGAGIGSAAVAAALLYAGKPRKPGRK